MLLTRARSFLCKTEVTPGIAETLVAADGLYNVYNLVIQPNITVQTRQGQGGFGRLSSVPGPRIGTATFITDLAYDGTNIPSWAATLLPACGWVNAAGTFTPRSEFPGANVKTVTIGSFNAGKRKRLFGAVGNARFVMQTGQNIRVEWTFQGVYEDEADIAMPAPSYPTTLQALRFAGGASTWAGFAMDLQQTTIDLGNRVVQAEATLPVQGVKHFVITDRVPTIRANPEAKLVATQARYNQFITQAEGALSFVVRGPATSTITFSAPRAQIVNGPQEGDRNGIVTDEVEWQCNRNGATIDQELSIVFAP